MRSFFSMIMVVLCLFGLTINNTFAQTESTEVEKHEVVVTMKNGEVFKGVIVKTDAEKMTIASDNGEINIFIAQIDEIEVKEEKEVIAEEVLDESDSNRSRYFLTSSAIPLEKGKGYYTNQLLFLNRARFGITKNLSMESGFFFFPFGEGSLMGYLAPQVSFKFSDKGYIGAGAYLIISPNSDKFSLLYGKTTFGDANSNISVGLGLLNVSKSGKSDFATPMVSVDFLHALDKNTTIVSENFIAKNEEQSDGSLLLYGMHGVRYAKNHNVFDIGLSSILGYRNTSIIMIPHLSYSLNF